MDDVEEQEKEARPLRKRKAHVLCEEISDSDSSDCYDPTKDIEDDTSDDSADEVKRRVKKKKETSRNNYEKISDHDSENNGSNDCVPTVKRKVKKNIKRKTNNNGAQEKARGENSKGRGRQPQNKSIAREIRKFAEFPRTRRKKKLKNKNCPQPQKTTSGRSVGPYSVVGHWYIATGFMKDLIALFEDFDEQYSWRFAAFATCWQKRKFSLIYRGRYSFKELLEFSQEICLWTKKFLSPVHSLKWRVGALYALYGLFYKHPFRRLYKIRMEMEAYENMVNLVRSFHSSAENPDPAYVFYKLTADDAFHHVASADEMGLYFHCAERQWEIMNYEMDWVLQEHSSESIFPDGKCNIQKTLTEEYEKVKTQVWGNDGNGLDKAMSYVQPNMLSEVRSVLAELRQDDGGQAGTSSQSSENANQSHSASTEISEIGQRVSDIRMKAAALCTTNDFLQRKLLRSPQKNTNKSANQHNNDSITGSGGGDTGANNLDVHDDNNEKIRTLRKIMEFMQPPEEGFDVPFKSLRTKKNRKVQNPIKEEIDSQDELITPDSPQEELKANVTSLQASQQKRKRQRKTNVAQMPLQSNKSHIKRKPRKTSLPKQEKKRKTHKKRNLKNSAKCELQDNSHIIMEGESEQENWTGEEVVISSTSVSRGQVVLQSYKKKEANEEILQSKECPLENRKNGSQNISNQDSLSHNSITKPTKLPSCNSEGRAPTAAADKEKNLGEFICVGTVASEDVYEGFDNQTTVSENDHEESVNDESVTAATNIPNVSGDTSLAFIKTEKDFVEASVNNIEMGNIENSAEMNFSDMNNVGRMLQVEILAIMPKKRSLQSTLKAKSMVYILVNFQEGNVKVHTVKFKMSKTDLKTIQSSKEKLNALKKRLHSLLPSKYKNYDLHLQLNIHESVLKEIENYEEKHFTHTLEPFTRNFEEDCNASEKYKQGPQAYDSMRVKSKALRTLNKTNNAIPHEGPMTSCTQKENVPSLQPVTSCTQKENVSSLMTEDHYIPSSLSPEIWDGMNHVRNVIQVEIVVNTQENYIGDGDLTKTESTNILNVNFQVEGITVHHAKFQISVKDFETLLNNNNKLESLMEVFRSFLPLKYKMYEIQLHSTVQQPVTEDSIDALQHSRQGSDPPGILPCAAATPFETSNGALDRKASTSPSQKGLSNFQSESSAAQAPQRTNVREVKEYHSLDTVDQGQYNTNTTAQPTCLTLDPHCLQKNTKSSLNLLISEENQHPDSCNILRSNTEEHHIHVSNISPEAPHKMAATTSDMLMDDSVTQPQVHRMDSDCPTKLLDFERSIVTAHIDNGLGNFGNDFMNTTKKSHTSSDMCFNPNTNEVSKNALLLKECTNDLDRVTCPISWKTRSSLNTVSDKNLLPSLNDCSSEHDKIVTEGHRTPVTKTVRNVDHGEPFASTSRRNLLPPQSLSPSWTRPGNVTKSGRAVSKMTNDNTVCSFYFFSKTNKYDASLKKHTRLSSDSDTKKASVKFLFMEKLFAKKKH